MTQIEVVMDSVQPVSNTDKPERDFWLIKSGRSEQPRWFAGYFFTYDFDEAVRFARQEDAQRVIDGMFSKFLNKYVPVQYFWE